MTLVQRVTDAIRDAGIDRDAVTVAVDDMHATVTGTRPLPFYVAANIGYCFSTGYLIRGNGDGSGVVTGIVPDGEITVHYGGAP